MRLRVDLFFAVALSTILAACSPGSSDPPKGEVLSDEPAAAPAQGTPSAAGSNLTGSVSGLTGEVTAFQVSETADAIVVDLAADVLFAFDSAELSPQAPEQLAKTLTQIRRGGSGEITVIGHTDSEGDDSYNDDLSLRRAAAVSAWLSTTGAVAASRLKPEGRGEREPVASNRGAQGNDDPAGRAMNRRVQVVIPRK